VAIEAKSPVLASRRLAELFRRNGYYRLPNTKRREEMRTLYKKGWEVRLILRSQRELREARRLLKLAGLRGGRPWRKGKRWAQPVYGKEAVDLFRKWTGSLD
jgi:hypothetical protein